MKKEIIAAILLVVVVIGSFFNIRFLSRLTDELSALVYASAAASEAGDWDTAEKKAEAAAELWRDSDSYTHIVLRHTEINSTADAIFQLLMHTYSKNSGEARGAAEMAIDHLESLISMERVRLGSIF